MLQCVGQEDENIGPSDVREHHVDEQPERLRTTEDVTSM